MNKETLKEVNRLNDIINHKERVIEGLNYFNFDAYGNNMRFEVDGYKLTQLQEAIGKEKMRKLFNDYKQSLQDAFTIAVYEARTTLDKMEIVNNP